MKHVLPDDVQAIKDTITPDEIERAHEAMEPFVTGFANVLQQVRTPQDMAAAMGAVGIVVSGIFASTGVVMGEEAAFAELENWVQVLRVATQGQIAKLLEDPIIQRLKVGAPSIGHG